MCLRRGTLTAGGDAEYQEGCARGIDAVFVLCANVATGKMYEIIRSISLLTPLKILRGKRVTTQPGFAQRVFRRRLNMAEQC